MVSLIVAIAMMGQAAVSSPLPHPPITGGVYVVAHRGAHEGIPENTLAAYAKAIELGCDFVEIDLRTTKDGELVSIHNKDVDAYTDDASGLVRDFTLAELKAMDIGSRVGPEWKNERVPTFEEILQLCQGKIGIYLDLKDGDPAQIVPLLKKYGMCERTIWYASPDELREAVALCPETHMMPEAGTDATYTQVLASLRPKVVAGIWRNVSREMTDAIHAAGAIFIVDESDPSCWEEALAMGIDGIQTDHPEALIAFLKDRAAGAEN